MLEALSSFRTSERLTPPSSYTPIAVGDQQRDLNNAAESESCKGNWGNEDEIFYLHSRRRVSLF